MQLRDWNGATGFIYSYFLPGWFTARNLGVGELLKRWKTIFLKFSANGIIFLTILVPFERNRRNGNGSVLSMSRQICTNFRFSPNFSCCENLQAPWKTMKRDNSFRLRRTWIVFTQHTENEQAKLFPYKAFPRQKEKISINSMLKNVIKKKFIIITNYTAQYNVIWINFK